MSLVIVSAIIGGPGEVKFGSSVLQRFDEAEGSHDVTVVFGTESNSGVEFALKLSGMAADDAGELLDGKCSSVALDQMQGSGDQRVTC